MEIERLLEKYWAGETSLEEERRLKAYFASGAVDPRFAAETPFFQALREEQAVQSQHTLTKMPTLVYSKYRRLAAAAAVIGLLATGSWWFLQKQTAETQAFVQTTLGHEQVAPPETQSLPAATILENSSPKVAETSPRRMSHRRQHHTTAAAAPLTEADLDPAEEMALAEVKAALALVSSKLNKGRRAATKTINQVETLDKFFKRKSEG